MLSFFPFPPLPFPSLLFPPLPFPPLPPLPQAAFRAGCVDVVLNNLTASNKPSSSAPAGVGAGASRRSVVAGSPSTPSTPGTMSTPFAFASPIVGAAPSGGSSSGSGASRASDADVVTVITNSFHILTLLLVSPEIVAAAKAAGCISAILEGYKRCARSRSLQGYFCQVGSHPPCAQRPTPHPPTHSGLFF
jgi:hypothetical protein